MTGVALRFSISRPVRLSPAWLFLLIAATGAGYAQDQSDAPSVYASATDGNSFREMNEDFRLAYVSGFTDALGLLGFFRPQKQPDWPDRCLRGRPVGQSLAIVDKYLAEHPETWHLPINMLVLRALSQSCKVDAP